MFRHDHLDKAWLNRCSLPLPAEHARLLPGWARSDPGEGLGRLWAPLAEALATMADAGVDVIIDAGRLGHRYEPRPLLMAADQVLLMTHSDLPGIAAAQPRFRALTDQFDRVGAGEDVVKALLVDSGEYGVRDAVGCVRRERRRHGGLGPPGGPRVLPRRATPTPLRALTVGAQSARAAVVGDDLDAGPAQTPRHHPGGRSCLIEATAGSCGQPHRHHPTSSRSMSPTCRSCSRRGPPPSPPRTRTVTPMPRRRPPRCAAPLPPAAQTPGWAPAPAPSAPLLAGTMTDPGGHAPWRRVDWALVRRIRAEAAERRDAQSIADPDMAREYAREVITQLVDDEARRAVASGDAVLTSTDMRALAAAAMDSLYGLGRFQPLVDIPTVENVEIRGWDDVLLEHHDSVLQTGPPVADSDAELLETLQLMASQLGAQARPFNHGVPFLNLSLPGNIRLTATNWVTDRPRVWLRLHRLPRLSMSDAVDRLMVTEAMAVFLSRR